MANRYASTVAEDPLEGTTGAMNPPQPGRERSEPTTTPLETKTREPEPDVDERDNAAVAPPEQELTQWLRAENAEISQLAGGLAHEIRNPLSTLSLNLDLLDEDFQEAESPRDRRIKQRVGRLKREVQRLYDILENFLRFARVQELKLASTDLNALVEELCDFYEPQATTLGIVVRTYFAPDMPRPVIDADLFKQAVLNLMLNAEHAMAEGGELIMTTRRDGAWIVLDVIDTAPACSRMSRPGSSTPSTRPVPAAAAWACRLPGRSSRHTVGPSRSTASPARDRGSRSACRCHRSLTRALQTILS